MENERKVKPEEGQERASPEMLFYETSAQTSFEGVQKVFQDVAKNLAETHATQAKSAPRISIKWKGSKPYEREQERQTTIRRRPKWEVKRLFFRKISWTSAREL